MPPLLQDALMWARMTGMHFLFMFWWIWLAAVVLTAASESRWADGRRRRLLERPDDGWRTIWLAVQLGVLSPPSRRRIFAQAREILARGVSRAGVLAYLVSAQALLVWFLFFLVELNGPQPALGQMVAVAVLLAVLMWGAGRIPDSLWAAARDRARGGGETGGRGPFGGGGVWPGGDAGTAPGPGPAGTAVAPTAVAPIARAGPAWLRPLKSAAGQAWSLWWPLLFGLAGVGFFLALGQSPAAISLQGTKGPLVQAGNAVAGLVVAYVTGAPMVGNVLFAAGLWKAEFVSYAGLSAFYLGTLVMPFVLPRYFALFGVELGKKVVWWLVAAILAGALAATAWWWGLDWLAGVAGVRKWFEALTDSTLRPNDVPWFHHWFAPGL